ncbi:MAG: hypothetical protein V1704_01760, partial [Candidatus Vogelbacteria bacterium]
MERPKGIGVLTKGRCTVAYYGNDCPIVLRLSGGIMKGENGIFDEKRLGAIVTELSAVASLTQLVVVVGGGNIARGRDLLERFELSPESADNIGIMATIINAYVLGALLTERKVPNVVVSAHNVGSLIPMFRQASVEHISE